MTSVFLFVLGIGLVLWAAERLTDGVLALSESLSLSPFFVGAVVSGFEPENLVTGVAANFQGLPQLALGTVIGATIFLLLGGLGGALLIVPMETRIPRSGVLVMAVSLLAASWAFWNDGRISRPEGLFLFLLCGALMVWLYRTSPLLLVSRSLSGAMEGEKRDRSWPRALLMVMGGTLGLVVGAELVVRGAEGVIRGFGLSETFFGMTVVAIGESLEEMGRMVAPARRGRSDIALGNVVGTTVILLTFNLGLISLVRPLSVDPWILRFHLPFLAACVFLVGGLLLFARGLGRRAGVCLLLLYLGYLAANLNYF